LDRVVVAVASCTDESGSAATPKDIPSIRAATIAAQADDETMR
jgi:hypothetical protein